MSGWLSFFKGWQFRTSRPVFEPGQQIEAYLTEYDAEQSVGVARIGDTVLTVRDASPADVDKIVTLRIQQFDTSAHRGEAERVSEL